MMPFHSPLQGLASTPGPVILINSVLTDAFTGILAAAIFSLEFGPAIVVALVALVVAFAVHMLYAGRLWKESARQGLEVRFPSSEK